MPDTRRVSVLRAFFDLALGGHEPCVLPPSWLAARGVRIVETAQPGMQRHLATEALTGNHNVARSLFRVGHDDQPGMGSYVADHGAR
jgi:hypothetical protein